MIWVVAISISMISCKDNSKNTNKAREELPYFKVKIFETDDLNPALSDSVAFSANDHGDVIGTYTTTEGRYAYVWKDGISTTIFDDTAPEPYSVAYDLNNHGQVVGTIQDTNGLQAFVWQDGLQILTPPENQNTSQAFAINNQGEIVGIAGSFEEPLPVLWINNEPSYLKTLHDDLPFGEAYDVNQNGSISGSSVTPSGLRAVIWHQADMPIDLGVLDSEALSEFGVALNINEAGEAVGVAAYQNTRHAFIYRDGQMHDIGDLPGGGDLSIAYGINNFSAVVGSSQVKEGDGDSQSTTKPALLHNAFIWTPTDGLINLNSRVIEQEDLNADITLLEAAVITDDYHITGRALVNGNIRGYLLSPVTN